MTRKSSAATFIESLSQAASEALDRTVRFQLSSGGSGFSGGGGATTSVVSDTATGQKYFVKSAAGDKGANMLLAEYLGVQEMAETQTIRVPQPVSFGKHENPALGGRSQAFVIFEFLEFTRGGSQYELGQNLAKMHRFTSKNGKFGFHVDNTIGSTFHSNTPWMDSWADFWDETHASANQQCKV